MMWKIYIQQIEIKKYAVGHADFTAHTPRHEQDHQDHNESNRNVIPVSCNGIAQSALRVQRWQKIEEDTT